MCVFVQVSVRVDQQRTEACVSFRATHPLILTDDVKFKFYCSSVCLCVPHCELPVLHMAFLCRNQFQLELTSVNSTSVSTQHSFKTISKLIVMPMKTLLYSCHCCRLLLRRADIDNMQKSRVRRIYPPSFSIEMLFEQWTEDPHSDREEGEFELVD